MRITQTAFTETARLTGANETARRSALNAPTLTSRIQLGAVKGARQLPGYPPPPPVEPSGAHIAFLWGVISAVDINAEFDRGGQENPTRDTFLYDVDGAILVDPRPVRPHGILALPYQGYLGVQAETKTDGGSGIENFAYITRAAVKNHGALPVYYFSYETAGPFMRFLAVGQVAVGQIFEVPLVSIAFDLPGTFHGVEKITRASTVLALRTDRPATEQDFNDQAATLGFTVVSGW